MSQLLAYSFHYESDEHGPPKCHNALALIKGPHGIAQAHTPKLAYAISHLSLLSFICPCSISNNAQTTDGPRFLSFSALPITVFLPSFASLPQSFSPLGIHFPLLTISKSVTCNFAAD